MGPLWKCVTVGQDKNVRLKEESRNGLKGVPPEGMMGAIKVPSSFGYILGLCLGNHCLASAPLGHAAHLACALGEHIIHPTAAKTPAYPPENEIASPFLFVGQSVHSRRWAIKHISTPNAKLCLALGTRCRVKGACGLRHDFAPQ